ncbi:DNA-binding protein WhiA, partial [Streptococcus danieliae]|nr:DNA-binding protein WhiA [Streptococcus danieliae]
MSYASDMKKELTMIELTDDPQFLSELSALIKMNGVLSISNMKLALTFQTENASIARRMFSLIKHFYDVDINISVRKKLKLKKNNVYICRLEERVKEILRDLYILNDN